MAEHVNTYPTTQSGRLMWSRIKQLRDVLMPRFDGVPMDPRTFAEIKHALGEWAERYFLAQSASSGTAWFGGFDPAPLRREFQVEVGPDSEEPTTLMIRPCNMFTILFLLRPACAEDAYQHRDKTEHIFGPIEDRTCVRFDPTTGESQVFGGIPTLPMRPTEFLKRTKRPPDQGELDRVNCDVTGEIGHWQCGWCFMHDAPEALCMCRMAAR